MTSQSNSEHFPEPAVEDYLRSFFRQELGVVSGRWPVVSGRQTSLTTLPTTPDHTALRQSRFALAASLLALVGGAGLAVSLVRPSASAPAPLPGDALGPKAEMPGKTRHLPTRMLPTPPKNSRQE